MGYSKTRKIQSINSYFYKNAKAVIIVYSITNKISFEEIKIYQYDQIKQHCNSDAIIAIAANKCDLYEQREVSDEEGEKLAINIGAFYASTYAKNDSAITYLFENIAMQMIDPDFDFTDTEKDAKKNMKIEKV